MFTNEDSTTSKESTLSHEGMYYIQDGTYCSKTFETTFSHHIDLCPFDSLNDTVSSNILDDVTSSFMVNAKAAYKAGEEVHETVSEKVEFNRELNIHVRPESVAIIKNMQNTRVNRLARVLFDPGSDESFIHRRLLPAGLNGKTERKSVRTITGENSLTTQVIDIHGLVFPEFSPTQKVSTNFKANIYNTQE